jgi:tetratricopeptide (TPR) repeat protein
MEILTNLGSTLFLLGELSESIERFREALAESEGLGDPVVTANAAMGLGWATFQSGDLKGAQRYTLLAINKFKEANHPDAVLAKHNLAIIEAARNNRETAYVILQSCLKTYREQGHIKKQASVLEEIARYWFQKGDLKRAEKVCWDALNLLDIHDNSLLRGRLYRFLGNIAASEENFAQAQAMLRVSHELFRCLKANAEAALSWESLEILKNNLAASQSASTQSSPE